MTNQNIVCDGSNWSVLNYNCALADNGLANHGISALGLVGLGLRLNQSLPGYAFELYLSCSEFRSRGQCLVFLTQQDSSVSSKWHVPL